MYDMENGLLCTVMHDGKEKQSSLQDMPAQSAARRTPPLALDEAIRHAGLGGDRAA